MSLRSWHLEGVDLAVLYSLQVLVVPETMYSSTRVLVLLLVGIVTVTNLFGAVLVVVVTRVLVARTILSSY
jgi:hypothetical protein